MALKGWKGQRLTIWFSTFVLPLPALMRIWALLFQVNSLRFDSVVVAAAGKAFESSVAAVPASAAVQPSSSLHPGTVASSASADLSAFDSELLYFLALSSSIPFLPSRIPSHSQIFLLEFAQLQWYFRRCWTRSTWLILSNHITADGGLILSPLRW